METLRDRDSAAPTTPPTDSPASARSGGPRIYYLHPLLAGPLAGWNDVFARIAGLGFDHVLVAPIARPGPSGSVLLSSDLDRTHPALEWDGATAGALARITKQARAQGLTPLLDVVPNRVAAGSPLALSPLYADPNPAHALDPRRYRPDGDAAEARLDNEDGVAALASWWAGRMAEWAGQGVAGFRFAELETLPAAFVAANIRALRQRVPDAIMLGWTPGTGDRLESFAGAGLDFVFSSLPWWDFRADWLWQEIERLRRIAPVIASPEAPFGRRLAASCRNPAQLGPLHRRALGVAATLGAGWMLPMGFEFAYAQPLDPRRAAPAEFARLLRAPAADLTDTVRALNERHERVDPLAAAGEPRLLTGPGAPVLGLLRPAGPLLQARQAALTVVNLDVAQPRDMALAPLLANAGGPLLPVGAEPVLRLAPGETAILTAQAAPAVQPPLAGTEISATEAAKMPRVAVEAVTPSVEGGAFAAKRNFGEQLVVEADIVCDGHDVLGAALHWRAGSGQWQQVRMTLLSNDRWQGSFPLQRLGAHEFLVEAWRDAFGTFRDELQKKYAAGVPITLELEEGRRLIGRIVAEAPPSQRTQVEALHAELSAADDTARREILLAPATAALMAAADPRPFAVRSGPYPVWAERTAAHFASWYEVFPRSLSDDESRHGTFDDVIRHLPRVRAMGFDVLYFPPIHPIGRSNRKGRNNSLEPGPDDPGSPYAIGSAEGGHDAIHPELGTFEDFRRLRDAAAEHGLELALDFAIQCSPDHPWLREHKGWFDWRPDGSIRYAENPPKKYQDIVNVDFYAPESIPGLWEALRDIVLFWAGEGVRIFRVDNPHTKPLPFWHWMIGQVMVRYPDTMFLAEAFTKPKMMYRLAKVGFSQSYTYFTWRNEKRELREYLEELTTTAPKDFFRPNFFVNTPDINPVFLQTSGRAGFLLRAALASTLSGLWGVYNGFELCEGRPLPGREEYADSEKYQLRAWDWDRPGNIVAEISRLNWLRKTNPALQTHLGVTFLPAYNDAVLYYEKATPDRSNVLLIAVSLDPRNVQTAAIELPLWRWGLPDDGALEAENLFTGARLTWSGKRQTVTLDPSALPFAIWRVRPAA